MYEKKGYKFFVIKTKGFKFNIAYHRLQAYQKYGDRIYKKGIEVRHLDNNPSNNSFNNIAIGTAAQNRADTPYEIRQAIAQKGGDTIRKYNHNLILTLHKIGISYNRISMLTKISKGQISWIINHSTESKKQ